MARTEEKSTVRALPPSPSAPSVARARAFRFFGRHFASRSFLADSRPRAPAPVPPELTPSPPLLSQNMFNKFIASKQGALHGEKQRRPYLASECSDLDQADKWRQEILREIGRKVMEIQNAGLGEHRLRDLNDEINKLIREKGHWERRILQLGGPNYVAQSRRVEADAEGDGAAAPGDDRRGGAYRYFGAAKQLPGVKELFEKPEARTVRRTRRQMNQRIDADYYGFRDEEDGVLLAAEAEAEAAMRAEKIREWEEAEALRAADSGKRKREAGEEDGERFVAHVPLPDEREIQSAVLQKKKADLMAKYASSELTAQEAEAKAMLNKQ